MEGRRLPRRVRRGRGRPGGRRGPLGPRFDPYTRAVSMQQCPMMKKTLINALHSLQQVLPVLTAVAGATVSST